MKTTLFSHFCKVGQVFKTVKRFDSNVSSTFKFSDLQIEIAQTKHDKPDPEKLVFGQCFSDHMFEVEWSIDKGWGIPRICPLHSLRLHPAAKVFHYASELFEGSKAYRGYDNKIRLFRPELNIKRMLKSAERAALPIFNSDEMIKCMKKLVEIEEDWVPHSKKCSLYIRPTLIGTEPCLGVNKPNEALLYILTGPVGPYFPTGFRPVSLFADPKYIRAWEGGCGSYKMGANYAPTVMIQRKAVEKGCQQVLWLYGDDHYVTEVGTMNLFMFWINENGEKELITPSLDSGLILPGITRQSILGLARDWNNFKVTEKMFTMKDVVKAINENRVLLSKHSIMKQFFLFSEVLELFGSGTACVVCPVESILYCGKLLKIPSDVSEDSLSMKFYATLSDIQYGKVEHPWATLIN